MYQIVHWHKLRSRTTGILKGMTMAFDKVWKVCSVIETEEMEEESGRYFFCLVLSV